MNINFVKQISENELTKLKFDFVFCSSGFESRSTFLLHKVENEQLMNSNRICFSFGDRKVLSKSNNDQYFKEKNFDFIEIVAESMNQYISIIHNIFGEVKKEEISIVVDYSCMTTIIYASILKYFKDINDRFINVSIYFSYSQALFTEPSKNKSISYNHPIPLFDPIQTSDKKIALLIGLGYEQDKALGLYEYFQSDSEDIYLFVTNKKNDNSFYQEVIKNNSNLIDITNKEHLIYYDIENVSPLLSTLDSLVNFLTTTNYRVVIAPIGPKVFKLIALLINLYYNNVTTYRLSDGNKGNAIDKVADEQKELIIVQLNLTENHKNT